MTRSTDKAGCPACGRTLFESHDELLSRASRESLAEIVRRKFWDMAELHGERAGEELAALILGAELLQDQAEQ